MDEPKRRRFGGRGPLRSFALGGIVGAAGAIATARRLRSPSRRQRPTLLGLAAFEDAPCFREAVEAERQRERESGRETTGDGPNPL